MEVEVGAIYTGKVTEITKFGAFVNIGPGKSGLVHISEIANTYVNDVHDFLTLGQEVKVKVVNIDAAGRLNLSIKATIPAPPPRRPRPQAPAPAPRPQQPRPSEQAPVSGVVLQQSNDASFEDKLKRFMQDSDSKISGIRQYAEKKSSRRRSK